jgi:curved DNA-binding protein CbpA
MDHYEVLRVPRDAAREELRRAYLDEARRYHPDHHRAGGEGVAAAAEDRMRRINEAWAVLGDPASRRDYDLRLAALERGPGAPGPGITRPSDRFVPLRPDTADDPDEDDAWRYEPDEGDPDSVPPRLLLAAPPALFAAGLGMLFLSFPLGQRWMSAVGLMFLLASALLFVGAPVVALFRSQITEERARRRR